VIRSTAPRGRLFIALGPVYLSVFLFIAGSSALQILVPVYLSRRAHFGPAAIGGIVGAYAIASLAARLRAAGFSSSAGAPSRPRRSRSCPSPTARSRSPG
jgi:hypothetical protein